MVTLARPSSMASLMGPKVGTARQQGMAMQQQGMSSAPNAANNYAGAQIRIGDGYQATELPALQKQPAPKDELTAEGNHVGKVIWRPNKLKAATVDTYLDGVKAFNSAPDDCLLEHLHKCGYKASNALSLAKDDAKFTFPGDMALLDEITDDDIEEFERAVCTPPLSRPCLFSIVSLHYLLACRSSSPAPVPRWLAPSNNDCCPHAARLSATHHTETACRCSHTWPSFSLPGQQGWQELPLDPQADGRACVGRHADPVLLCECPHPHRLVSAVLLRCSAGATRSFWSPEPRSTLQVKWKGTENHKKWKQQWSKYNNEFCSVCELGGDMLLCCDGCPAAYHFACCDPPLNPDDLPEGDWFCHNCVRRRNWKDQTGSSRPPRKFNTCGQCNKRQAVAIATCQCGFKFPKTKQPHMHKSFTDWREGARMDLQCERDNLWYSGAIIMKSKKRVKVAYDGWDSLFNEWVKKTTHRVAPTGTWVSAGESGRIPAFAKPPPGPGGEVVVAPRTVSHDQQLQSLWVIPNVAAS